MRDSSGLNWLSHFCHGTSRILQLFGPETLTSTAPCFKQRRDFFLATRVFEISRSLIYSSDSFLSEPIWTEALSLFWLGEGAVMWHPKEALFDLLPLIAELSIRTIRFCSDGTTISFGSKVAIKKSLGDGGFVLRTRLQQWYLTAVAWDSDSQSRACRLPNFRTTYKDFTTESLTGFVYFHAASIYLSGTYDYHPHWTAATAPILSRGEIEWHVSEILRLSHELLDHGTAGLLLFFPLRVAGARATDAQARARITDLLQMTVQRGFVVAEAFVQDLSELWKNSDAASALLG